jgi:hypothetical protein
MKAILGLILGAWLRATCSGACRGLLWRATVTGEAVWPLLAVRGEPERLTRGLISFSQGDSKSWRRNGRKAETVSR